MSQTIEIELRNHPAQAEHPITGKKLFDSDGNPVPLLPTWQAIYLLTDGPGPDLFIGYVTPNKLIQIQVGESRLGGRAVVDLIRKQVAAKVGGDGAGSIVPDESEENEPEELEDIIDELEAELNESASE